MPEPGYNQSTTPLVSAAYIVGTHKIVSEGVDAGDGITTVKTAVSRPNQWGSGIRLITDISNFNGGSLTITIKAKTENGIYATLLASAALSGAAAVNVLEVFPAAPVAANRSANAFLGSRWEITYVVGTAAVTFSSSVEILR